MEIKTPIKILTLSLFVTLIFGFVLYKGGYIFFKESQKTVQNKQTTDEMKASANEDYELNIFQHLKSVGGFTPKNFDTLYTPPLNYNYYPGLSSSKFILVSFTQFDYPSEMLHKSYTMQLKEQFKSIQSPKN
jgi:hypothetical protein